ncbi:hypothetical protein F5148DRAFT_1275339 [Russula earlei]|uniref:Uncharacterized protein n=1 Tax=Russula earlei TaxID=71964 RepID=A0ACC0UDB0_9AGAM|nr:hypothetical protein F5148DRAFT_1275339 [Russula earlei]
MSANFNPYVQGWRVGNAPSSGNGGIWGISSGEPPSVFGALPGGQAGRGTRGPPAPGATIFYITDFRPNVLNASVLDARGRQCYKIHRTVYYDADGRTVALVDWAGASPSVEMPGLLPRQALRSWLHTAPDRASRVTDIRGIPHVWVPDGEDICRLGRIGVTHDAVQIELSEHAMESHLAEVCILSASIFLSGFRID